MKFIKFFEELSINDIPLVGGKNASLGEMIKHLTPKGVLIPSGFALTADAYRLHLEANNLTKRIKELLEALNVDNIEQLTTTGHEIRTLIYSSLLPQEIVIELKQAYAFMEQKYGTNCDVAVRSSATAEDLPEASFAGQQETYLNIRGEQELINCCRKALASLFTNRAISYRAHHNFDHMQVALSVGVQKMVRSDLASAGVIFTLDTESGFKDVVFITAAYGLGENVVQGAVNPDEYYVHKPTLKQGFKPLLKKRLGKKHLRMVYTQESQKPTANVHVPLLERSRYALTNEEVLSLAQQAIIIEEYYSNQKGYWCPMDIEWAKDGSDGKLYIVQARPETVHSRKQKETCLEEYYLKPNPQDVQKIIARGKSVGRKIATGKARVIQTIAQMNQVQKGDILVTDMTDPDWEPIMKIAAGIITNRGGRTCHAAIVSRELGIPAIVGTTDATDHIKPNSLITMDCSSGEVGVIYEGEIPFEIKKIDVSNIKKPPVNIMVNVGNPEEAFNFAQLPNDGVGLARLEFIINNSIQVHPMALVQFDKVTKVSDRQMIEKVTLEYPDKKEFFIDKLAEEAGTIAAAFYPKPVIIRMSDFKSNEYKQLIGGSYFEPVEENPMIGFRGASRYYHERYKPAFALECAAMKKIRDDMGLNNVILMIPFIRTVDEAKLVVATMKEHGLEQGKNGLQLYMMCEIPSNVILIEKFADIFDGFSIGSNDLTQTTLAVDRDSDLVASIFDERNEAVKAMLTIAIQGAHKKKKKIGICGQAPSDYPEVAEFLVSQGINSISLNPDSVLKEFLLLSK